MVSSSRRLRRRQSPCARMISPRPTWRPLLWPKATAAYENGQEQTPAALFPATAGLQVQARPAGPACRISGSTCAHVLHRIWLKCKRCGRPVATLPRLVAVLPLDLCRFIGGGIAILTRPRPGTRTARSRSDDPRLGSRAHPYEAKSASNCSTIGPCVSLPRDIVSTTFCVSDTSRSGRKNGTCIIASKYASIL